MLVHYQPLVPIVPGPVTRKDAGGWGDRKSTQGLWGQEEKGREASQDVSVLIRAALRVRGPPQPGQTTGTEAPSVVLPSPPAQGAKTPKTFKAKTENTQSLHQSRKSCPAEESTRLMTQALPIA